MPQNEEPYYKDMLYDALAEKFTESSLHIPLQIYGTF